MSQKQKSIVTTGCLLAVMLLLPLGGLAESGMREWTSSAGDTIKAELVRQSGFLVVLQGEDGQQFQILTNQLSAADQTYLREQTAAATANAAAPARRLTGAASRSMLTEAQIASMVTKDPENPEAGERYVEFTGSVSRPTPTAAQRSRGRIPFRIVADFQEVSTSGGRVSRRRLSGVVKMYVLNAQGELVDNAARAVDKMCPG